MSVTITRPLKGLESNSIIRASMQSPSPFVVEATSFTYSPTTMESKGSVFRWMTSLKWPLPL